MTRIHTRRLIGRPGSKSVSAIETDFVNSISDVPFRKETLSCNINFKCRYRESTISKLCRFQPPVSRKPIALFLANVYPTEIHNRYDIPPVKHVPRKRCVTHGMETSCVGNPADRILWNYSDPSLVCIIIVINNKFCHRLAKLNAARGFRTISSRKTIVLTHEKITWCFKKS